MLYTIQCADTVQRRSSVIYARDARSTNNIYLLKDGVISATTVYDEWAPRSRETGRVDAERATRSRKRTNHVSVMSRLIYKCCCIIYSSAE